MDHTRSSNHTPVSLTGDAWLHPHVFAAAFNSGDPDEVERVYEADAVLLARPGQPVVGEDRRTANGELMALGVPIEVNPKAVYVNGDLALMIVDWSISGTTNGGQEVDVRGTATDVARRGADGYWRYVIDNPWGHGQSPHDD